MSTIYALAALQGIILAAFLFIRKQQAQSNRLLALYLLILAFSLFSSYLSLTGKMEQFTGLIGLDTGVTYLCGPFLWVYALLLTGKADKLKWKDALHLIPFLVHMGYLYFNVISQPVAYKLALIHGQINDGSTAWLLWSNGAKIAHSLVYYWFTFRLIRAFQSGVLLERSGSDLMKLQWLQWVLGIIFSISVVMGIWFIIYVGFGVSIFNPLAGALINIMLFVLVYAVAFFALRFPQLFGNTVQAGGKYSGSTVSKAEGAVLWSRLKVHMESVQPFCTANLTITDLSEQLEVNSKTLSRVINEYANQNFFSFINSYRVEEFKKQALDPANQHLTLLAIAEQCGFSSKSSFHAIFKKQEGCTPRQYLAQLKAEMAVQ